MNKTNHKFITLLVLILAITTVTGCNNKVPEGVRQQFYEDMLWMSSELNKVLEDKSSLSILKTPNNDYDTKLSQYNNNIENLTSTEKDIFECILNLSSTILLYHEVDYPIDEIIDYASKFSELMEIDYKITNNN